MNAKSATSLLKFVPKNQLSRLVGALVHRPLPGALAKKSVRAFAKYYRINLEEAEYPIEHYQTIGDLFTRKLKQGVRPIQGEVVHPADSKIAECAPIADGNLIQAKGKLYTVAEFLGSEEEAKDFIGGWFATYYLCPTDYHRVHAPVSGNLTQVQHIPGKLWPVNNWGVENIERLFAVNERVVMRIETKMGPVAVVMVGATNVGKITLAFDPDIISNSVETKAHKKSYHPPVNIRVGDELGVFHMGSTVVVLYPKDMASLRRDDLRGLSVKVNQSL